MKRLALVLLLAAGVSHLSRVSRCSGRSADGPCSPVISEPFIVHAPLPPAPPVAPGPVAEPDRGPLPPPPPPLAPAAPRPGDVPARAGGPEGGPSYREVTSQLATSNDRAREDARKRLDRLVADWLAEAGVPGSWSPPRRLVDALIVHTEDVPEVTELGNPELKDYELLYRSRIKADFSPARRAAFVATYDREVSRRRLGVLGGVLGFVLVCLAAVSSYIRADEATKGYYTNRLRLLAAAGVGAAGMVLFRWLV